MICRYNLFMKKDNKVVGWYQTDTEDFKKLWKKIKDEIRCAVVKTEETDWIFYRKAGVGKWEVLRQTRKQGRLF